MLQIENAIVSIDIFEEQFSCDLLKCKGQCCVEGDAGAPLEIEECTKLETYYEDFKPYMRKEGIEAVENQYLFICDQHDDTLVTPLVNNSECAYVTFENDMAFCAIEKAYHDGKIPFRKPISCHLYPIRITAHKTFDAVNYHKWTICKDACSKENAHKTPLYLFLKEPLVRKYGIEWYNDLVGAGTELGWIKNKKK